MDSLTLTPQKKNNKQGTEKDMQQRGWSALSALEKGGRQGAELPAKFQETKPGKVDG
jgi:hypothetical protein